jgi:hypothetical protein
VVVDIVRFIGSRGISVEGVYTVIKREEIYSWARLRYRRKLERGMCMCVRFCDRL